MTSSERRAGGARRILVVEDAYLTARLLTLMLEELGYDVAGPAADTESAARILDTEEVDAALLDVTLRGELVTPVADRLLELQRPFVFLTAYTELSLLPPTYRGSRRLHKPCTRDALAAALEELF